VGAADARRHRRAVAGRRPCGRGVRARRDRLRLQHRDRARARRATGRVRARHPDRRHGPGDQARRGSLPLGGHLGDRRHHGQRLPAQAHRRFRRVGAGHRRRLPRPGRCRRRGRRGGNEGRRVRCGRADTGRLPRRRARLHRVRARGGRDHRSAAGRDPVRLGSGRGRADAAKDRGRRTWPPAAGGRGRDRHRPGAPQRQAGRSPGRGAALSRGPPSRRPGGRPPSRRPFRRRPFLGRCRPVSGGRRPFPCRPRG
jgi:hypothetical protein